MSAPVLSDLQSVAPPTGDDGPLLLPQYEELAVKPTGGEGGERGEGEAEGSEKEETEEEEEESEVEEEVAGEGEGYGELAQFFSPTFPSPLNIFRNESRGYRGS